MSRSVLAVLVKDVTGETQEAGGRVLTMVGLFLSDLVEYSESLVYNIDYLTKNRTKHCFCLSLFW